MICKRICVGLRDPNAPSGRSAGAVIAMSSWENKRKSPKFPPDFLPNN